MAAHRSPFLAVLLSRPRLLLLVVAGVTAAALAGTYVTFSSQQSRQELEQLQLEQRLRIETRKKVLALQRKEEELVRQDQIKQQLDSADTVQFQLASLRNDLINQEQQVRVLRREAAERQVRLVEQDRERRKKEIQELLRTEINKELGTSDGADCIEAYNKYKAKKADPAASPAELIADKEAIRSLCQSNAKPAGAG